MRLCDATRRRFTGALRICQLRDPGERTHRSLEVLRCARRHTFWNSRIGEIRLFSLWSLAERFFEPFCNSVDFSVGIVENAALFGQHVLEVAATRPGSDRESDKSARSLNPLAFNLEKCDELRAFDTHVFGSTTYNRHTGVRRLPGPGPGVHRNFFPDRAGVPLSNGLEIRSLFEHSLLCSTLHRCSQAELEAPIAGVAVCNSPAAQAAWL